MTEQHPRKRSKVRLNGLLFAMMLEELLSGPCTSEVLAEHTGLCLRTVRKTLQALHERKLVYIAAWEKDSIGRQAQVKVYAFGQARDAKRPTKSSSQVQRDYRARKVLAPLVNLGAGG